MLCPICSKDTKVLESRLNANNTAVRRRRECLSCAFRFSTGEEIEILDLQVLKRTGEKQPYTRAKLIDGLKKSLQKRDFTEECFKKLVHDIERDIQLNAKENTISSEDIGEMVIKHLKSFDTVAYVRFASVYRDFKDAQDFAREVSSLKP